MKTDPQAALAKAIADRSAAADRLVQLRDRRAASLLDEGIESVARIDRDIGATQGTIAILDDRIEVLRVELAKRREEQRERDKVGAIEELEAKFKAKDEAARELEVALAGLGSAFVRYREATAAVFVNWPHDLFGPSAAYAQSDGVAAQIGGALGIASAAPDVRIAEVAARVGKIADDVASSSAAILDALRRSPLPMDVTELGAAA